MRVGIVAQRDNPHAAYLAAEIRERLGDGIEVWLDAETATALSATGTDPDAFDACDLVVSIGGDGTFLFAARNADATPVLGVNLGEVGFLNAVAPSEAVEAVEREVERFRETGAVRSRTVPRLAAAGEGEWSVSPALNEVAVHGPQRGHGNGLNLEVRVDGELYAASRADGVIVATPTGSTAYNLSEGGPLVRPGTDAVVVTWMCPDDRTPPLVVDADAEVTVRVDDAEWALVASDGADRERIAVPQRVAVGTAPEPARVAGPDAEFFRALGKLE